MGVRLLNRDGTFNVERQGKGFLKPTDLYHSLLSVSRKKFFALIILSYFCVNILFGLLYFLCGDGALGGVSQAGGFARFMDCFFFSVQTLGTIGYGRITPNGMV